MLKVDIHSTWVKRLIGIVQHYNPESYWRMREKVVAYSGKGNLLIYWYLYRIKRMDAFNNASLGTNIGSGAFFEGIPRFPHGLNGIIISPYARIGRNVRIFQQVTIGDDGRNKENAPVIRDDVFLYPGCKILGKCEIGKGAKIGANAVVSFDVPPNAIVTVEKPKIYVK